MCSHKRAVQPTIIIGAIERWPIREKIRKYFPPSTIFSIPINGLKGLAKYTYTFGCFPIIIGLFKADIIRTPFPVKIVACSPSLSENTIPPQPNLFCLYIQTNLEKRGGNNYE